VSEDGIAIMKWLKGIGIVAALLIVVLAALPFFISLNDYIPQIEKAVSARVKEPVTIQSMRVVVLPLPHVKVDGITVGKAQDIKVGKVAVTPDLLSLFGSIKVIRNIEIDSLVLTQQGVDKIPVWTKSDGAGKPDALKVRVQNIRLDGAQVRLDKASLGPFDARIRLTDAGEPQDMSITTQDGKLKVFVKPGKGNYLIDASARSWKLPVGPAIAFDELAIKGVATLQDADLTQVSARLYGGTVNGKASIGWQKGLQLRGSLEISQVELRSLVPLLAPGTKVSGRLDAKTVFSARAANAAQLGDALQLKTPFTVHNGVLHGVDIQKAATKLVTGDSSGGETRFAELSGHLVMERGTQRFTQIRITSGVLSASGNVSISPRKELSGRINAEVKATRLASAGVPLNVSGTTERPLLLPTGATATGAAVGTVILGPGLGTSVGAAVGGWTERLFGKTEEKR
jgi:uncharacterized protein involved in outer membrane biogenesis